MRSDWSEIAGDYRSIGGRRIRPATLASAVARTYCGGSGRRGRWARRRLAGGGLHGRLCTDRLDP